MFGEFCRVAPTGLVLGLVGPTQVGKTYALGKIVAQMQQDTRGSLDSTIPLVDLQIESVSEGRVKGKWLDIELLKALRHPVYMHIGELDERDHYAPSRGRDEGSLRTALKAALKSRKTERVVLDEAHLLTRTTKGEFRGNILESLKCIAAIERTVILCGGYELAYKGLFDNAHFAGRVIIYDFSGYENTPEDLREWARILQTFSNHLPLSPKRLLVDRAEAILRATNGSVGLLEKWLWACRTYASIKSRPIDIEVLRKWAPSLEEQRAIATDIARGKKALETLPTFAPRLAAGEQQPRTTVRSGEAAPISTDGRNQRKPFERSPRRTVISDIELYIDD